MPESALLESKVNTALVEAQKASDYMDIQNLVSAHLYCYRAQEQYFEIENFWATERDDISYAENKGRAAVINYYCKTNHKMRKAKLELAHSLYPHIEIKPENEGVGDMVAKLSTNPYVVFAQDGMSAKGIWFSPGICSEIGFDGRVSATYFQEKISLIFVREREGWKILSLDIFPELIVPMPPEIFESSEFERTFGTLLQNRVPGNESDCEHKLYSAATVAKFSPSLPLPYETWDDSRAFC